MVCCFNLDIHDDRNKPKAREMIQLHMRAAHAYNLVDVLKIQHKY